LLERQETLLAVTGQVGDPLYSNTREAVLRLKHPIRGIDTVQSIRWIRATSMMEGETIDMKWGTKWIKQE
jgi:hypothetical protein